MFRMDTCVLESGLAHHRVPSRRMSEILRLSAWERVTVRGMHSSVSSVAYPNIKPCNLSDVIRSDCTHTWIPTLFPCFTIDYGQ